MASVVLAGRDTEKYQVGRVAKKWTQVRVALLQHIFTLIKVKSSTFVDVILVAILRLRIRTQF